MKALGVQIEHEYWHSTASTKVLDVLVVEDCDNDRRRIRKGLKLCGHTGELYIACDGAEALQFLRREKGFEDAFRPDLVITEINLPKFMGWDVLFEVRRSLDLQRTPVVVFTHWRAEGQVGRAFDLQASAVIEKPIDLEPFLHAVRSIHDFWMRVHVPTWRPQKVRYGPP